MPRPIARGVPGSEYPFVWAVYKWLEGETFDTQEFGSRTRIAEMLAKFVAELQMIDTTHAPKSNRDAPLDANNSTVLEAIESLDKDFDRNTVRSVWDVSVQVPAWEGDDVWILRSRAGQNQPKTRFSLKEARQDGKLRCSLFNQEGNGKHMTIISAFALNIKLT